MEIAANFDRIARQARDGQITEARVRATITDLISKVNGPSISSRNVRDFLEGWIKGKEHELSDGSIPEYTKTVQEILISLGSKADQPLDVVTRNDVTRFRDRLAKRLAATTTNKYLKIARIAWADAQRDGLVSENVFAMVRTLKAKTTPRRPFTMPELQAVLAACDEEWRGMVLAGLYTGQRLGDIAELTWRQVDFEHGEIQFITKKTGKSLNIPLAKPLEEHLLSLPSSDDPDDPVFPTSCGCTSNTLSRRFSEILMAANLIPKKNHGKRSGAGRAAKRNVGGLSFHCLRHTATSLLKNAGVSDVVARTIIGHDSAAISQQYTHIETGTLREAITKLPDIGAS
jgi:integrase